MVYLVDLHNCVILLIKNHPILSFSILDEYKNNRALNARIPNYNVSMGFGLHVGWAIEVILIY